MKGTLLECAASKHNGWHTVQILAWVLEPFWCPVMTDMCSQFQINGCNLWIFFKLFEYRSWNAGMSLSLPQPCLVTQNREQIMDFFFSPPKVLQLQIMPTVFLLQRPVTLLTVTFVFRVWVCDIHMTVAMSPWPTPDSAPFSYWEMTLVESTSRHAWLASGPCS